MDDFDPRDDKTARRRRYGLDSEVDGAWGAADEEDLYDLNAEIEAFAAGYVEDDVFASSGNTSRRMRRQATDSRPVLPVPPSQRPRAPLMQGSYDPARGYPAQGPLSTGPAFDPFHPPSRPQPNPDEFILRPGPLSHLPYWSILLLVILTIVALTGVAVALISIRLLVF